MDIKSAWKKTWYFIWHDDSILSWVANVILAFVLIKYILYPLVGLIFGTHFPVVAVISESMQHDGSFNNWWATQENYYQNIGITKDDFLDFSLKNGFNKGDIMVLYGTKPKDIKVGNVIVFKSSRPYPIIHRVIKIRDEGSDGINITFETKGDHNTQQIIIPGLDETNVSEKYYVGRAIARIPYVGYVKIWFANLAGKLGLGALFN